MAIEQDASAEQGQFPLDSVSYDLICLIHEKTRVMEALDRYLKDATADRATRDLLLRIRASDGQWVHDLEYQLAKRLTYCAPVLSPARAAAEVGSREGLMRVIGTTMWDLYEERPRTEFDLSCMGRD